METNKPGTGAANGLLLKSEQPLDSCKRSWLFPSGSGRLLLGSWPLLDHHFLVFAVGLDMGTLVLPWSFLVGPLPFMAAGFLVAAVASCSWSSSQSSWRMVPPIWSDFLHGKLHSWQVGLLATLRIKTQLPHGFCGFWHWTMMSHSSSGGPGPHLPGSQLASSGWQLASSWLLALRHTLGLGLLSGVDTVAAGRKCI